MLDIDCQESIGGDFLNSCINVIIKEYNSTDENAASMCKVTADCKTMFEGLPNKQNEAYLTTQMINIDNKMEPLLFWKEMFFMIEVLIRWIMNVLH